MTRAFDTKSIESRIETAEASLPEKLCELLDAAKRFEISGGLPPEEMDEIARDYLIILKKWVEFLA